MRHVNKGQVIVREFVEADREALRKLFVASRDAAFSWAAVGAHKLEDFDVSTAGERILVAEHSCTPIGFASVWQTTASCITYLFIRTISDVAWEECCWRAATGTFPPHQR